MRFLSLAFALAATFFPHAICQGQADAKPPVSQQAASGTSTQNTSSTDAPTKKAQATADSAQSTADKVQKQVDDLQTSLDAQSKQSDFQLTLGIGSLVTGNQFSDYTNQANTLQATSLGLAIPQYLIGVSLRTHIPNFPGFRRPSDVKGKTNQSRTWSDCYPKPTSSTAPSSTTSRSSYTPSECEVWRQRPFSGFISLKFAPNSSQTLSGYVIGGSYSIAKYLNMLIGFALTPENEPSPGFEVAASQFVTAQQALGNYLNYNPGAMLRGDRNAFDGFSLTDSTGKLIYKGSPLEVHYRGGVVFGVSIPLSFASVFTSGQKQ